MLPVERENLIRVSLEGQRARSALPEPRLPSSVKLRVHPTLAMTDSSPRSVPVLLLVRELGVGGTERQLVETARFLQRERFIPHVGCFRPEGPRRVDLERAGVPILHLPVHSL